MGDVKCKEGQTFYNVALNAKGKSSSMLEQEAARQVVAARRNTEEEAAHRNAEQIRRELMRFVNTRRENEDDRGVVNDMREFLELLKSNVDKIYYGHDISALFR